MEERTRLEEILGDNATRDRLLAEGTSEGVLIHEQGYVYAANTVFLEMFGYSAEEAEGMSAYDVLSPEAQDIARHRVAEGYDGAYEVIGLRRNGEEFPVEINPKVITTHGHTLRVLAFKDITEQRKARDAMAMFQAAIEGATDGIGFATPENKILYANRSFYSLYGYDFEKKDLEGIDGTSFSPEDDRERMASEVAPDVAREGWRGEARQARKDGSTFEAALSYSPIRNPDGEIIAISVIATDITAERELQEQIRKQSEAIMEMSTPVIKVWNKVLMLPMVGAVDTSRAQQMTEKLLESVVQSEAEVALLDVTGVPVIDTSVARNLLKAVDAARMLGAEVIVTGFSPEAAQTLAQLGVDFSALRTRGSLQAGLREAFAMVGVRMKQLTD